MIVAIIIAIVLTALLVIVLTTMVNNSDSQKQNGEFAQNKSDTSNNAGWYETITEEEKQAILANGKNMTPDTALATLEKAKNGTTVTFAAVPFYISFYFICFSTASPIRSKSIASVISTSMISPSGILRSEKKYTLPSISGASPRLLP